jgi:hypothetical protein
VKSGIRGEISIAEEASIQRSSLWDEIKDEIEPQLYVTLVFFAKLLLAAMEDEKSIQPSVVNKGNGNYGFRGGKDEMGRRSPSP